MNLARPAFDRILHAGGVFVVFAEPRTKRNYVLAEANNFGAPTAGEKLSLDNWSFLSSLCENQLIAAKDYGEEMSAFVDSRHPLG